MDLIAESNRISNDLLATLVDEANLDWKEVKKTVGFCYGQHCRYWSKLTSIYTCACTHMLHVRPLIS